MGMDMQTGRLTGTGARHAGTQNRRGILETEVS